MNAGKRMLVIHDDIPVGSIHLGRDGVVTYRRIVGYTVKRGPKITEGYVEIDPRAVERGSHALVPLAQPLRKSIVQKSGELHIGRFHRKRGIRLILGVDNAAKEPLVHTLDKAVKIIGHTEATGRWNIKLTD